MAELHLTLSEAERGLLMYALIDSLRADARDLRLLPRPAWVVLILVPIIGPVLAREHGGKRLHCAHTRKCCRTPHGDLRQAA